MCFVIRTLHIPIGQNYYKVRYCVKRRHDNEKVMLVVTALVNGTSFREALNELIKCAEFRNSHRILLYTSAFIFRHYLFVEYDSMAYDLEQILHIKCKLTTGDATLITEEMIVNYIDGEEVKNKITADKSIELIVIKIHLLLRETKKSNEELSSAVLNEAIIGHILRKILKALSYLHRHALHNNLVSRSIIVTNDCDIKLAGFKWTIMKNEDIRKTLRLRNNRFFGRPTQWAPEEALNDIEHYGPHTELWHVGLLIPEMVTGQTYHLINTTQPDAVKQFAQQLMKFQLPVPYNGWYPNDAKFSLSSELLRLWHRLMQPNYEQRPTVDELLERKISKIIRSIDKSKISETLLTAAKKYRLSDEEQAEALEKWTQLVNYSYVCGANDITRVDSLYLGMGRNEFFSTVSYSSEIDDKNPLYSIDHRQVPNDLLMCVRIVILKNEKKLAGLAVTIHRDMNIVDMCTVVCRHIYKFVQNEIIGFINYIDISLEIIKTLKRREKTKAKHLSWKIFLEGDEINEKPGAVAHVQVIFNGSLARFALETSEQGSFEIIDFNRRNSQLLETFSKLKITPKEQSIGSVLRNKNELEMKSIESG